MSRTQLAVYGAGYLGQQVYHHVATYCRDTADVIGFVDDTQRAGLPVVDGQYTLGCMADAVESPQMGPDAIEIVFAIGYASMRRRREALERVLAAGYRLYSVVHPRAVIEPNARVARGCIVLAGAVIDQHVSVGAACFVDIGVRLTAGTVVGCNNYFSSGTATGSRVKVGDDCFFGMDCSITTEVQIGSNVWVNAKTLVPRNVGDSLKLVEVHKGCALPMPSP
jgi:acetyltransferase-like isoleucine patch superfamily enzyme